jgi:hypothetical protein
MTDGEKMIWAAVFGHAYNTYVGLFRLDMNSGKTREDQMDEHRQQGATLAVEAATRGVEAARHIQSCDIDLETTVMMGAMFECE